MKRNKTEKKKKSDVNNYKENKLDSWILFCCHNFRIVG